MADPTFNLPPVVQRVLSAAVLGIVFVLTASVIVPDWTRADDGTLPSEDATSARSELPMLGSLESTRYRIDIFGSDDEPRYTVVDRGSGRVLGTLLTAQEMAYEFPDLDLRGTDFSTPSPLQLMLHTEPEMP